MRRLALFVLLAAAAAAPARAQLFDDNEARRRVELLRQQLEAYKKSVDERMTKAESTAQAAADRSALLDLASQIETLRGEIAKMRGQLEVIANQAETAEARQKQLYLDIDTRLRKLETAPPPAPAAETKPPASAAEAEPSPGEAKAYQAALDQFKLGNYSLAVAAMQGFLVT